MKIRWHGSGTRIAGAYEWSEGTGYVQTIEDEALCAELLSQPGETFTVETDTVETGEK